MNAALSRQSVDNVAAAFVTTHWSVVLAAQGESEIARDRFDEADELGRPHAGIAALLIDLVAGGFDQDRFIVGRGERGLDDQRVS